MSFDPGHVTRFPPSGKRITFLTDEFMLKFIASYLEQGILVYPIDVYQQSRSHVCLNTNRSLCFQSTESRHILRPVDILEQIFQQRERR